MTLDGCLKGTNDQSIIKRGVIRRFGRIMRLGDIRILKEVYSSDTYTTCTAEDTTRKSSPNLDLTRVYEWIFSRRQDEQFERFAIGLFSTSAFLQVLNGLNNRAKIKLLHFPPTETLTSL
ncbi:MAG: hypothetical protein ACFFDI_18765 [Promethearchaeota archaeon]